jgi:hypothetical protein
VQLERGDDHILVRGRLKLLDIQQGNVVGIGVVIAVEPLEDGGFVGRASQRTIELILVTQTLGNSLEMDVQRTEIL